MTIKHLLSTLLIASATTLLAPISAHAQIANETRYPVVLAHGMAGWDTIAGYSYFGEDGCTGDCDNDGAAGQGDGSVYDMDDDGLVGINSQQMGYRLKYTANDWECTSKILGVCMASRDPLDTFSEVSSTGYVGDLNAPTSTQMNSHDGKLSQDHLDVMSIGPDSLDEEEFYAGLFQHIYNKGY